MRGERKRTPTTIWIHQHGVPPLFGILYCSNLGQNGRKAAPRVGHFLSVANIQLAFLELKGKIAERLSATFKRATMLAGENFDLDSF